MISDERYLSTEEVAEQLAVDEQTVRRWIKSGRLQAYKPGRAWRIPPDALAAFLEDRRGPLALAPPNPNGSDEERRAAAELEAHTGLVRAASRWGREEAEREDLSAVLAEAVCERLEKVFGDGYEHYHTLVAGGISEDAVADLAGALMDLVLSMNEIEDVGATRERDPAKRGRLVDLAARRRRERPEVPRSVAG